MLSCSKGFDNRVVDELLSESVVEEVGFSVSIVAERKNRGVLSKGSREVVEKLGLGCFSVFLGDCLVFTILQRYRMPLV